MTHSSGTTFDSPSVEPPTKDESVRDQSEYVHDIVYGDYWPEPAPLSSYEGFALAMGYSWPSIHQELEQRGYLQHTHTDRVRFPQRRQDLLRVLATIGKYHLVDDPSCYVFAMAVAVSNSLGGSPLWGMIVGPASGGKTEALAIVRDIVANEIDDFTVPALLSNSRPDAKGKVRPTGILPRVGPVGMITIGDFSTVLSDAQRGHRDQLFSALRRIFDGRYQRDLGNEDKALVWTGRVTLLAACTSAIDNFSAHSDSLGPRWVYFRMASRDTETRRRVTSRAVRTDAAEMKERRADAQLLAGDLIDGVRTQVAELDLPDELIRQVEDIAQVVCFGRASVPRESSPRREITGLPDIEEPPRVAKQLIMLLRCLIVLGLSDGEALAIVARVGIDCMPATRALALGAVSRSRGPVTTATIAKGEKCDWKVINRALEDFEMIGLVHHSDTQSKWDQVGQGAATPNPWILAEDVAELVRSVFDLRNRLVLPELAA